jgi:hypothetical protein
VDLDFTHAGFPWPPDTVAWHGTAFVPEILAQGFKTRSSGAAEMAGGRWVHSTSLTLVERRAAAIALGLDTLTRAARGDLSLTTLIDALTGELGRLDGTHGPLISGANFQNFTMTDPENATRILKPVFARLDEGWTYVSLHFTEEPRRLPRGWKRLCEYAALAPPDAAPKASSWWERKDRYGYTHHDRRDAAFELYRRCISWGQSNEKCFDPHFTGTSMEHLAKRPKGASGILACRIDLARVCSDAPGAVQLGYWPKGRDMAFAQKEAIEGNYNACSAALDERDSEWGQSRATRRIDWPRFWDQPWPVREQEERARDATMLYSSHEEELMVFDPRRIRVVAHLDMAGIRKKHHLGKRVSFPFFLHEDEDVQVWPPREVRILPRGATRSGRPRSRRG